MTLTPIAMTTDDFNRIAANAADMLHTRCGVCQIGVRRLHTGDGTWGVVFGQQPLREPFVGMVNTVMRWITANGGEPIVVGANAKQTTWAMLARLPRDFDFRPFRSTLYALLADRSAHTVDQIKRFAGSAGESALLDAHDVFSAIAGRVAGVVHQFQLQGSQDE